MLRISGRKDSKSVWDGFLAFCLFLWCVYLTRRKAKKLKRAFYREHFMPYRRLIIPSLTSPFPGSLPSQELQEKSFTCTMRKSWAIGAGCRWRDDGGVQGVLRPPPCPVVPHQHLCMSCWGPAVIWVPPLRDLRAVFIVKATARSSTYGSLGKSRVLSGSITSFAFLQKGVKSELEQNLGFVGWKPFQDVAFQVTWKHFSFVFKGMIIVHFEVR